MGILYSYNNDKEFFMDIRVLLRKITQLGKISKSQKKIKYLALVAIMISTIISVILPSFNRYIIDDVLIKRRKDMLTTIIVAYVLVNVVMIVFNVLKDKLFSKLCEDFSKNMKEYLMTKIFKLPNKILDEIKKNELITVTINDIENVKEVIATSILNLVYNSLIIVITFIYLAFLDLRICFVILPTVPVFIIALKLINPRAKKISEKSQESLTNITSFLTISSSKATNIKNFSMENEVLKKFNLESVNMKNISISNRFISLISSQLGLLLVSFYQIIYFFIAGYMYINYNIFSIGLIFASSYYFNLIWEALSKILSTSYKINSSYASLDRILYYVNMDTEDNGESKDLIEGYITFEDVDFKYKDKEILSGFNLKINPGDRIVLVGESGKGKSTLAKLMVGLYDVTKGGIYIDGKNINELNISSLRRQISIVEQEPCFFKATIKENLIFDHINLQEAQIIDVCKVAQIHDFIMTLPMGYDTLVGDNGTSLSGGQRQRLALARTLLRDSKTIILDEITSALDYMTEEKLLKDLNVYLKDKTIIIIAHRETVISQYDKVIAV